jgi:hypothetical protein
VKNRSCVERGEVGVTKREELCLGDAIARRDGPFNIARELGVVPNRGPLKRWRWVTIVPVPPIWNLNLVGHIANLPSGQDGLQSRLRTIVLGGVPLNLGSLAASDHGVSAQGHVSQPASPRRPPTPRPGCPRYGQAPPATLHRARAREPGRRTTRSAPRSRAPLLTRPTARPSGSQTSRAGPSDSDSSIRS